MRIPELSEVIQASKEGYVMARMFEACFHLLRTSTDYDHMTEEEVYKLVCEQVKK